MVHELMIVFRLEIVVTSELVSHNRRAGFNEVSHGSMHGGILAISNHSGFDLSAALKCSNDYSLAVSALHPYAIAETAAFALVHIAGFSANVSFVNLNRAIRATKFPAGFVLQSQAQSMQHEPCRLLADAKIGCQFIRTDSVFAVH